MKTREVGKIKRKYEITSIDKILIKIGEKDPTKGPSVPQDTKNEKNSFDSTKYFTTTDTTDTTNSMIPQVNTCRNLKKKSISKESNKFANQLDLSPKN